ncbi:MAG: hypothetical protein U0L49_03775 [Eubacterium sp.]|nr:hypothetical protein [Eubacterium sp.]
MVSRRNLFNILTIIFVIFALFQGTLVMRERLNNYESNNFREETGITSDDCPPLETYPPDHSAAFAGDPEGKEAGTIREWADDARYTCSFYSDAKSLWDAVKEGRVPALICIEGSKLQESDLDALTELAGQKTSLVFSSLPDPSFVREHPALMDLLGIQEVRQDIVRIEGVHLYSGFLLGGERIYEAKKKEEKKLQDLNLDVPWYITGSGTETYMNGLFTDKETKSLDETNGDELLPALIWRCSQEHSRVFSIAGDYMQDRRLGIGLLSAILAKSSSYAIYPVINAQNLTLISFPTAANENAEEMQRIYGRSMLQLENQIILPQLQSLSDRYDFTLTGAFTPKLDFSDEASCPDGVLDDFLSQMNEMSSEFAVSLMEDDSLTMEDKAEEIHDFLQGQDISYPISAAAVRSADLESDASFLSDSLFDSLQTLSTDYTEELPAAGFLKGDVSGNRDLTVQQVTQDMTEHTYSKDLELLGTETALAYTNWSMDITSILLPKTEEDEWQEKSKKMFANIVTAMEPFEGFDRTSLSEGDASVRRCFALNYSDQRKDNTISVSIEGQKGGAYFLLRTEGEHITDMSGGTWKKIEDGAYLIKVSGDELEISLARDDVITIR